MAHGDARGEGAGGIAPVYTVTDNPQTKQGYAAGLFVGTAYARFAAGYRVPGAVWLAVVRIVSTASR